MATMRAKLKITGVDKYEASENVRFTAVGPSEYPADGTDENNTYAKWTPSAELSISITNPNLLGRFEVGQEYYVDFHPALPATLTEAA